MESREDLSLINLSSFKVAGEAATKLIIDAAQRLKSNKQVTKLILDGLYISTSASVALADALSMGYNEWLGNKVKFNLLSMMGCSFENEYCAIRLLQTMVAKQSKEVTFFNPDNKTLMSLKNNPHALDLLAGCKMLLPSLELDEELGALVQVYKKKIYAEKKPAESQEVKKEVPVPIKKIETPVSYRCPAEHKMVLRAEKTAEKLEKDRKRIEQCMKEIEEKRKAEAKAIQDRRDAAKQKRLTLEGKKGFLENSVVTRRKTRPASGPLPSITKNL